MITYVNLPKGKKGAFLNRILQSQKQLQKFLTISKQHPRLALFSMVGFLVLILGVTVFAAVAQKGKGSFLVGKPTINSLSSHDSIPSALVEIKGKRFGNVKPSKNLTYPGAVIFTGSDTPVENPEGVEAMLVSWSDSKISFFVPPDALSGYIYVVNREDGEYLRFSNGEKFSVKKPEPKITSLSIPTSKPSEIVAIKGEGLGNFMSGAKVGGNRQPGFPGRVIISENEKTKFDVAVMSWTDNQIDFYTPSTVKQGDIQVTLSYNDQEVTSNPLALTIDPPTPDVASLQRDSGLPTELVTITGEDFGRTLTNPTGLMRFPGRVLFGRNEGLVSGWSPDTITVYVPVGVRVGSQEVRVVVDYLKEGGKSNTLAFNVQEPAPKIEDAATSAFPSEAITIKGSGFGDQISSDRLGLIFPGKVYFSPGESNEPTRQSVLAPILSWSDNSIQVNVPVGVQEGKMFIGRSTGNGDYFTEGLSFSPKVPEPEIDSLSEGKATPGQMIEIYGKNLGTQMGTTRTAITYPGKVFIGDKAAIPVFGAWKEDRIVAYVPWGAKSGNIKVSLQIGNRNVTSNEKELLVQIPKIKIDQATLIDPEKNRVSLRGEGFGGVIHNPYIGTFYPGKVFLSSVEKAEGNDNKVLGATRVEAKVEAWMEDKVIITLPRSAKKGYLYVSVEGGEGTVLSNGSQFDSGKD